METLIVRPFKDEILKIFPNSKPFVITDDDGNIDAARVFVTEKITSQECTEAEVLADNHDLDYAIKSTGAAQGLVIQFNK